MTEVRGSRAGTSDAGTARPSTGGSRPQHKPTIRLRPYVSMTVALLRRWPDLRALWFQGRIDPAFREELMLAVAGANSCRQCSYAHREWALAEGLPREELAALEGLDADAFDERKWSAVAWAHAFAASDLVDAPAAIDANFREQFSVAEQRDIELVARAMTWMNHTSNTVDAAWARLHGDPIPGSGVVGELLAVSVYALVTPVILGVLSVKQRRSPIALVRGISPFFGEFEARSQAGST